MNVKAPEVCKPHRTRLKIEAGVHLSTRFKLNFFSFNDSYSFLCASNLLALLLRTNWLSETWRI